jgi:hypothetical protein
VVENSEIDRAAMRIADRIELRFLRVAVGVLYVCCLICLGVICWLIARR